LGHFSGLGHCSVGEHCSVVWGVTRERQAEDEAPMCRRLGGEIGGEKASEHQRVGHNLRRTPGRHRRGSQKGFGGGGHKATGGQGGLPSQSPPPSPQAECTAISIPEGWGPLSTPPTRLILAVDRVKPGGPLPCPRAHIEKPSGSVPRAPSSQ